MNQQEHAWYLNPETGDTKVFATMEAELIQKAGYRLVTIPDLPLLMLHAKGLLLKTPPALLARVRDGSVSLAELEYDSDRDVVLMREEEGKLTSLSELGRLL